MMNLPPEANTALTMLETAGYEAYLVGGAVRDYVRGGSAGDWDIATSALPGEVETVFSGHRLVGTGRKHGTVTVLIGGTPIEITTFRVDGGYSDHRHPDSVRFTESLREDLARRDFTMNALAYAPRTGLVDPYGGVEDIAAGRVRCVGEPERRFREDGLRILRALRFASTLGFQIEENTAAAIHRSRALLGTIAAERVQAELTKTLCGPGVGQVLEAFADVFAAAVPELAPMFGFDQHNIHHDRNVWDHTIAVTEHIPADPVLRWTALLHDVGKPSCFSMAEDGVGHFYGHAQKSAELAESILTRLRLDAASRERIVQLIRCHDFPLQPERRAIRHLLRRLGEETLRQLIEVHLADTKGQSAICMDRLEVYGQVSKVLDDILAEESCFSLRDLAVNGHDLLALGLRGRELGAALDRCLNAVIDETLPNERAALLRFVRETMERQTE